LAWVDPQTAKIGGKVVEVPGKYARQRYFWAFEELDDGNVIVYPVNANPVEYIEIPKKLVCRWPIFRGQEDTDEARH